MVLSREYGQAGNGKIPGETGKKFPGFEGASGLLVKTLDLNHMSEGFERFPCNMTVGVANHAPSIPFIMGIERLIKVEGHRAMLDLFDLMPDP